MGNRTTRKYRGPGNCNHHHHDFFDARGEVRHTVDFRWRRRSWRYTHSCQAAVERILPMSSNRKTKNANRRLGDRLWSPDGAEYGREIGSSYFLTEPEMRSVILRGELRSAVQSDHSALEWLDPKGSERLLRDALRQYPLQLDGKVFMPTLWRRSAHEWLLLFEENH